MKKLSIILIALLMFSLSIASFAGDVELPYYDVSDAKYTGACGKESNWALFDDGILMIYGAGPIKTNSWDRYKSQIKQVNIEYGITEICSSAFWKCQNLEMVVIPSTVTTIGSGAFASCSGLTHIEIPTSVSEIGDGILKNCVNIKEITAPFDTCRLCDYFGGYNTNIPTSLKSVKVNVSSICDSCFAFCDGLTSIIVPNGVDRIENNAFLNCTGLTSISIPQSVCFVGNGILKGCDRLTEMEAPFDRYSLSHYFDETLLVRDQIPTSLKTVKINSEIITDEAFYLCETINDFVFSSDTNVIGQYAFFGCKCFKNLIIPSNISIINNCAFLGCPNIENVYIPENVSFFGVCVFKDCDKLKNIDIAPQNKILTFEDGVLYSKNKTRIYLCLKTYDIGSFSVPNTVTSIDNYAFEKCKYLTDITFTNSLETIGSHAFSNCDSIKSVVIPDNIKQLGDNAFECCASLKSAEVSTKVPNIGKLVFDGCNNLNSLTAPFDTLTILDYFVIPPESLTHIKVNSDYLHDRAFEECKYITHVTLPSEIKEIPYRAFANCIRLTSINLPLGIEKIGKYAFYNCRSLPELSLPLGVTSIGHYAFMDCSKLTKFEIPISVTEIGYGTLMGCSYLEELSVPFKGYSAEHIFGGSVPETLKKLTLVS